MYTEYILILPSPTWLFHVAFVQFSTVNGWKWGKQQHRMWMIGSCLGLEAKVNHR